MMPKLVNFKILNCNYRVTTVRTVMKLIPKINLGPHTHSVKISVQYLNPIKSLDEKTIFDDFQKFRRALTEIVVTFPKLKFSRQIWNLM